MREAQGKENQLCWSYQGNTGGVGGGKCYQTGAKLNQESM